MIDGTFDGKPSVITKGLHSFYASDIFSKVSPKYILFFKWMPIEIFKIFIIEIFNRNLKC